MLSVLVSLAASAVTFESLLSEMTERTALASLPTPAYQSLQASSYNRESVARDKPGWFADSDGTGFIRTEQRDGKTEWVIMEHEGPGCITKIWTPFFYYDFNDRVGPNVRVYLDGSEKPVFDESLIKLVTGQGSVASPWAEYSARAGNLYLPIPFAKSCKVTLTGKAFYNSIAYRAYPKGTRVTTYRPEFLKAPALARTSANLQPSPPPSYRMKEAIIQPGKSHRIPLPKGPCSIATFAIAARQADFRTTVIAISFDGEDAVWCPLGDFFSSADTVHPFQTRNRQVTARGLMVCRWVMPYRQHAEFRLLNLGRNPAHVSAMVTTKPWKWDGRSMHFHARWRPDDVVPGTPFQDWNFIDIHGQGVYVGDAWTVLNIRKDSWWGEGDEKVYVDDAWDKGFPTHFGTGTEDYYGWAGGVYPVAEDEFSKPFVANVKVGGLDGHTQGYNICTRERGLDAIPFRTRLRFDMESSFGTDMREKWDLLDYSAVTFWYARPGAKDNRPPMPDGAQKPMMNLKALQKESDRIKGGG